ncbi:MAG: hypothetical protein V4696_12680 [Pseudomonadota bacterium]
MRQILTTLAGAALLASCGPGEPTTLANAAEAIKQVNTNSDHVNIRLQFDGATTASALAEDLDDALAGISRSIADGASGIRPHNKFMLLDIRTGGGEIPDRFGNYRFDLSSFTSADGAARDGSDILNSLKDADAGSGDMVPAFVAWCNAGSDEAQSLQPFCERLAASWANNA